MELCSGWGRPSSFDASKAPSVEPQIEVLGNPNMSITQREQRIPYLPGRLITPFHFLIDSLINILSKSTNILDLNSGIVKPSKAWMVCQKSIKSEHPAEVNAIDLSTHIHTFSFLDGSADKYFQ